MHPNTPPAGPRKVFSERFHSFHGVTQQVAVFRTAWCVWHAGGRLEHLADIVDAVKTADQSVCVSCGAKAGVFFTPSELACSDRSRARWRLVFPLRAPRKIGRCPAIPQLRRRLWAPVMFTETARNTASAGASADGSCGGGGGRGGDQPYSGSLFELMPRSEGGIGSGGGGGSATAAAAAVSTGTGVRATAFFDGVCARLHFLTVSAGSEARPQCRVRGRRARAARLSHPPGSGGGSWLRAGGVRAALHEAVRAALHEAAGWLSRA